MLNSDYWLLILGFFTTIESRLVPAHSTAKQSRGYVGVRGGGIMIRDGKGGDAL